MVNGEILHENIVRDHTLLGSFVKLKSFSMETITKKVEQRNGIKRTEDP